MLFQTGGRFSAKAVAPSIASPLANDLDSRARSCAASRRPRRARRPPARAARDSAHRDRASSRRCARRARAPRRRPRRPGTTRFTRPSCERAVGVDRVAGHRELERDRERHALREPDQPAGGGHQPALHLGDAEPRGVGRDDEVARQHDLEAAGERGAVDRGDDRLREVARRRCPRSRPSRSRCRRARPWRDDLEVGAGREHLARAGEHDRAQRRRRPRSRRGCRPSSALTSGLIALRASGRLSVTSAVEPRRSNSTTAMRAEPTRPVRRATSSRPGPVDAPASSIARVMPGRTTRTHEQRRRHQHGGAGRRRAQPDAVGDLALERPRRAGRASRGSRCSPRARGPRRCGGRAQLRRSWRSSTARRGTARRRRGARTPRPGSTGAYAYAQQCRRQEHEHRDDDPADAEAGRQRAEREAHARPRRCPAR